MARRQTDRDKDLYSTLARAMVAVAGAAPVDLARFDGRQLLPTLARHGILALIDQRCEAGLITGLSEGTQQQLRALTQREAALDLAMNHSLGRLAWHLGENGFRALVLKGSALAHRHYPESRLRPRCDTDLWIRQEDAEALAALLERLGYQVVRNDSRQRSRKQFHITRETFQGDPLWFDVHYRLSNRALFRELLDFQDVFERAQNIEPCIGDIERGKRGTGQKPVLLQLPDNPTLLLHAAIHRIAHGRNSDSDRLLWLYDMHLLFEQMSVAERQQLEQLALDRAQGCLLADALGTCAKLFQTGISGAQLKRLEQRRRQEPSAALLTRGKWAWAWSDLRGEPGLGGKAGLLAELLQNRSGN